MENKTACQYGKWTSILTTITAAVALGTAVTMAPARSGPNCAPLVNMGVIKSCIDYPYTDVADFVPVEYIWMYPALLLSFLFVVLISSVYHCDPIHKSISTHIALMLSVISAAVHSINYFIQLAVVQPSLLKDELESLILLSQYNPHGVFIALEDLGYFLMGLSFGFLSLSFVRTGKLIKSIKYIYLSSSVITVAGLIIMAFWYRSDLEYRYEVLSLTLDWLVLIVTGVLLFFYFKRIYQHDEH
jgi:hypothetical protein